ncbi:MAG TPA: peroxiredoxin [Bryobacteraceae bacterium]|nr:peroxiredoxin [Bryobacteraceae bacterium]
MNQLHVAALIAAVVLPFGTVSLFGAPEMPQAGQEAPNFTLPSQDGTSISLNSFRGKWVVLYFYPKDNTPGCTIEAHNFQRDLAKYDQENAVIVGVSVDSTGSHQDFCAKQGLTFKLLSDTGKQVVDQYGSLRPNGIAFRNTFLVNPEGKIVKVWTGVNPSVHSEEVLAALSGFEKK